MINEIEVQIIVTTWSWIKQVTDVFRIRKKKPMFIRSHAGHKGYERSGALSPRTKTIKSHLFSPCVWTNCVDPKVGGSASQPSLAFPTRSPWSSSCLVIQILDVLRSWMSRISIFVDRCRSRWRVTHRMSMGRQGWVGLEIGSRHGAYVRRPPASKR